MDCVRVGMGGKVADDGADGPGAREGAVVLVSSRAGVSRRRAESLALALCFLGVDVWHCVASHEDGGLVRVGEGERSVGDAGEAVRGARGVVMCLDAALHGALQVRGRAADGDGAERGGRAEGSGGESAGARAGARAGGRSGVVQVFQAALREVGASGMLCVAVEAGLEVKAAWRGLVAFHLGGRGFAPPVAFLDDAVLPACVWSARVQSVMGWLVGEGRVVEEELEHDPCAVHHMNPSHFMPWLGPPLLQHEVDREWRKRRRTHARVWSKEHRGFVRPQDASRAPGDPAVNVIENEWVTFPFTGHWTMVPYGPPETMDASYDGMTAREAVAFRANDWYIAAVFLCLVALVLLCLGASLAALHSGSGGTGEHLVAIASGQWLCLAILLMGFYLAVSAAFSIVQTAMHPVMESHSVTALLAAHRRRAELQVLTEDAVLPEEHPLLKQAWGSLSPGAGRDDRRFGVNPAPHSHGLVVLEDMHRALASQRALVAQVQREVLEAGASSGAEYDVFVLVRPTGEPEMDAKQMALVTALSYTGLRVASCKRGALGVTPESLSDMDASALVVVALTDSLMGALTRGSEAEAEENPTSASLVLFSRLVNRVGISKAFVVPVGREGDLALDPATWTGQVRFHLGGIPRVSVPFRHYHDICAVVDSGARPSVGKWARRHSPHWTDARDAAFHSRPRPLSLHPCVFYQVVPIRASEADGSPSGRELELGARLEGLLAEEVDRGNEKAAALHASSVAAVRDEIARTKRFRAKVALRHEVDAVDPIAYWDAAFGPRTSAFLEGALPVQVEGRTLLDSYARCLGDVGVPWARYAGVGPDWGQQIAGRRSLYYLLDEHRPVWCSKAGAFVEREDYDRYKADGVVPAALPMQMQHPMPLPLSWFTLGFASLPRTSQLKVPDLTGLRHEEIFGGRELTMSDADGLSLRELQALVDACVADASAGKSRAVEGASEAQVEEADDELVAFAARSSPMLAPRHSCICLSLAVFVFSLLLIVFQYPDEVARKIIDVQGFHDRLSADWEYRCAVPTGYDVTWRCHILHDSSLPESECPLIWIGDGECDDQCNHAVYGNDGGDCDGSDPPKTGSGASTIEKRTFEEKTSDEEVKIDYPDPYDWGHVENQFTVDMVAAAVKDHCGCENFDKYLVYRKSDLTANNNDIMKTPWIARDEKELRSDEALIDTILGRAPPTYSPWNRSGLGLRGGPFVVAALICIGVPAFTVLFMLILSLVKVRWFRRGHDSFATATPDAVAALPDKGGSAGIGDARGEQGPLAWDIMVLRAFRMGSNEAADLPLALADALRARGLSVYARTVSWDEDSPAEIQHAIESSRSAVVCIGAESAELLDDPASWVSKGVESALRTFTSSRMNLVKVDAALGYPSSWTGHLGALAGNSLVYKCHNEAMVESCADAVAARVSLTFASEAGDPSDGPGALGGGEVWGSTEQVEESRLDVFLSHDWGSGGVNHARVARINSRLQEMGVSTWFDGDRMGGDINKAMEAGLEQCSAVAVFVTSAYVHKVTGDKDFDNCRREYSFATRTKPAAAIMFIVMEEDAPRLEEMERSSVLVVPSGGDELVCVDELAEFAKRAALEEQIIGQGGGEEQGGEAAPFGREKGATFTSAAGGGTLDDVIILKSNRADAETVSGLDAGDEEVGSVTSFRDPDDLHNPSRFAWSSPSLLGRFWRPRDFRFDGSMPFRVLFLIYLPLAFYALLLYYGRFEASVPLFPMRKQGTSCMTYANDWSEPGCPPPVLQDVARWENVSAVLHWEGQEDPLNSTKLVPRKYDDVFGSFTWGFVNEGLTERTSDEEREALYFLLILASICFIIHVLAAVDLYLAAIARTVHFISQVLSPHPATSA